MPKLAERSPVAITGATGFIGRHLLPALLNSGYPVIALGRRAPDFEGIEYRETGPLEEMTSSSDWASALTGVDSVIHLAALAHQLDKTPSLETFMRVNVDATAALAQAVRDMRIRRLVFVSSIGAVTSFADTPLTPTTPCAPDSDYGRSKRAAELKISEILSEGPSDYVSLRPNLVYGPDNPGNMARLLHILEKGLPLPLASVNNRRSFIYVGNLCALIIQALVENKASRLELPVADPSPLSTPDLIRAISDVTGKKARLFPFPVASLMRLGRIADRSLSLFGKDPKVTYALERLTRSLSTDMGPTLEALGPLTLIDTHEGIARSFGKEASMLSDQVNDR